MHGWIGVDLDGTLMHYEGNADIMGEPIPVMVQRVKNWLRNGREVRIFTARVSIKDELKRELINQAIRAWCLKHIGVELAVTCVKDVNCEQIWDDKAVRVVKNTGLSESEYNRLKTRGRTRRIAR